jgi:hypothetical protein
MVFIAMLYQWRQAPTYHRHPEVAEPRVDAVFDAQWRGPRRMNGPRWPSPFEAPPAKKPGSRLRVTDMSQ